MNNGNGKPDQRLVEAQRRLTKSQEPLQELDKKIAALQGQLTAAQQDVAKAEQEHGDASTAFVDDDNDKNSARLLRAGHDAEAYRIKVKVLTQRLATLQAQREPLDRAVQQASTILSQVTTEVRLEVLDKEMATAKYKIAEFQQGIFEWDRRFRAMKEEHFQIESRQNEANQRANQMRMREQFLRTNPTAPGGPQNFGERIRH